MYKYNVYFIYIYIEIYMFILCIFSYKYTSLFYVYVCINILNSLQFLNNKFNPIISRNTRRWMKFEVVWLLTLEDLYIAFS